MENAECEEELASKGRFILGPIWSWAHLELSPLGLEVGLNFSPTLQSGL